MELKKGPVDNNQDFDNSSYYQSNDPFSSTNGVNDPFGSDGMGNSYYSEQGTYDSSMNPYNQINNDQPMNPYVQAGYGRVDLNDGYYDEEAAGPGVDSMGVLAKTAGMGASLGGMMDNISDSSSGFGYGDDNSRHHSHHNHYHHNHYGRRGYGGNPVAAAVSGAFVNEVLVSSFLYMFIALLITGTAALIIASNPTFLTTVLELGRFGFFIIFIAEIGLVFACTSAMKSDNFALSAILFFSFSAVNGITFSVIFLVFQLSSIVTVFFMTSVVFFVMSMYGAITKKDLTGWGPILFGGLVGVLVGSLVNILLGNTMVDLIVTVVGVVVFSLYTAYDVNKITKMSRMNSGLSAPVLGMYGAMELYLDFINLFLKLLRLFGKKK
ncbi:Integral membrane protein, interacts with FtsH [Lachnospiraceae bacterium NE2001]|nr:Integral membrane protein, interacts with FtsH [Lachnospiraceae bacterium NE2001]